MKQLRKSIVDLRVSLDETFERTSELIDVYGTSLEDALKNQLLLQLEWELINKRARKIHSLCDLKVDEMYSQSFKTEMSNSYKNISTTEGKEFAKVNPGYIEARYLLIDAAELKEEAAGLLEVVISRKYILNNLTNAIIAAANKEVL